MTTIADLETSLEQLYETHSEASLQIETTRR